MASFKHPRDDSSPDSHNSSETALISVQDVKKFMVRSASSSSESESESESEPDLCGPHLFCCGGTVVNDVYAKCEKRLGKQGSQHLRGQVCFSMHKYYKCASCKSVVHSGCGVMTASGKYLIPNEARPFQCRDCQGTTCDQVTSCCHLCTLNSLSLSFQPLASRLPLLYLHKQRQNQTLLPQRQNQTRLPKKLQKKLCV